MGAMFSKEGLPDAPSVGSTGLVPITPSLRRLREARFMSQRELAEISGVAQPTIAKLESRKRGTLIKAHWSTIRKLAEALGVSPLDLMAWPEGEEPQVNQS